MWRKRRPRSIAASMNDGTVAVVTADTTMTDQFSNVTFAYYTWIHPTRCRDVWCNSCQCLMKRFMGRVSIGGEVYVLGTSSVGGSVTKETLMKWSPTRVRRAGSGGAHSAAACAVGVPRRAAPTPPGQCNQCAIKWEQRWEDRRASCVRRRHREMLWLSGDEHTCRWRHVHLTHHVLIIWERQCYDKRARRRPALAARYPISYPSNAHLVLFQISFYFGFITTVSSCYSSNDNIK